MYEFFIQGAIGPAIYLNNKNCISVPSKLYSQTGWRRKKEKNRRRKDEKNERKQRVNHKKKIN
jgi:CelD/BcsL family acetyltransferase involved in cellulose biosynthesis